MRAELGDPGFTVNDETLVLAQRFRLVHTVQIRDSFDVSAAWRGSSGAKWVFARVAAIWHNELIDAPVKRSLIAYDH